MIFQSTLPRGERRFFGSWDVCRQSISIHAPTRGATISSSISTLNSLISIHAPTRGATRRLRMYQILRGFQSTLPRGERQEWWRARPMTEDISIHASTRGATITEALIRQSSEISIHASTRGATCCIINLSETAVISIHASTRGATATLTNFFFYNQSIFC